MTGMLHGRLLAFVLALITALSTACAPQPQRPDPALDQAIVQAERAQDPIRLAAALWRKAKAVDGARSSDLQLRAIEVLIDAGRPQDAQAYLAQANALKPAWLTHEPRRARIVQGFEALQLGRHADAISILNQVPAPLAPQDAARRLELMAQVMEAERRPLDAVRQRSALDGLLPEALRLPNQEAILRLLGDMEQKHFNQALIDEMDPILSGWLQLIHADRQGLQTLEQWRLAHPSHPLLATLYDRLKREAALRAPPKLDHIALILSQDPRLADAARAITAGVLRARDETGDNALPVREYPIDSDPQAFLRSLEAAIAQGATRVIGPLDRKILRALADIPLPLPTEVPIIALNTLGNLNPVSPSIIQFGLPPEAEAVAAADRLIGQGSRRVLLLAPADSLGERMTRAFSDRLTARGGQLVETMRYGNQPGSWATLAQALLKPQPDPIDGRLRMREDADALYLISRSADGGQWVSLLRQHGAGNLPMFSSSHIYEGAPNPARDRQKDGLIFSDMPLILSYARLPGQADTSRFEQAALSGQPRLFALGYDAYQIATRLDELRAGKNIQGQTGKLRLDTSQRIVRTPNWALFRGGLPNSLELIRP